MTNDSIFRSDVMVNEVISYIRIITFKWNKAGLNSNFSFF